MTVVLRCLCRLVVCDRFSQPFLSASSLGVTGTRLRFKDVGEGSSRGNGWMGKVRSASRARMGGIVEKELNRMGRLGCGSGREMRDRDKGMCLMADFTLGKFVQSLKRGTRIL